MTKAVAPLVMSSLRHVAVEVEVEVGVAGIHPHLVMAVVAVIRGLLAAVVVPDIGTHLTGVEVVEAEAEAASVEAERCFIGPKRRVKEIHY